MNAIAPTGSHYQLPKDDFVHVQRSGDSDYVLGEFRAWPGYKRLLPVDKTNGILLFQHVQNFRTPGSTGVHAHFANAQIVVGSSGKAVFSYDGLETPVVPGGIVVQNRVVHNQLESTLDPSENHKIPLTIAPTASAPGGNTFSFFEIFIGANFPNPSVTGPEHTTDIDNRTAFAHDYHGNTDFAVQQPHEAAAAYRPVKDHPALQARDCATLEPTGGLIAVWLLRPASAAAPMDGKPFSLSIPGQSGGLNFVHMVNGSAAFVRKDGSVITLAAGDSMVYREGLFGAPTQCSKNMEAIFGLVSREVEKLRSWTPAEIERIETLGPGIITRQEVRRAGDTRPANYLSAAL